MGSSSGGQWYVSWAFSSAAETPFQTESPRCGPVLPEKTEAKVRTFTGLGRATGEGGGLEPLVAVSAQGVLEGDGCATKPPGLGDMVVQRDLEEAPVVAGPEDTRDTQDLEGHSPPQSLPSSPNAGESLLVSVFPLLLEGMGGRAFAAEHGSGPGPGT